MLQTDAIKAALTDANEPKYVIKRDGSKQEVDQTKIRRRMECHMQGLNEKFINKDVVVNKVFSGIYSGKFLHFILLTFKKFP